MLSAATAPGPPPSRRKPNRTLVRYRITVTDNPRRLRSSALRRRSVAQFRLLRLQRRARLPGHVRRRSANAAGLSFPDAQGRLRPMRRLRHPAYRLVAGCELDIRKLGRLLSSAMAWSTTTSCIRLHGGNGRYTASGTGGAGNAKRSFKFLFHKGYEFDAQRRRGRLNHPGRLGDDGHRKLLGKPRDLHVLAQ